MNTFLVWLGVSVLVLAALIFVPLGEIWALNTLFGLTIPYALKTWAAALLLGTTVFSSGWKTKK